MPIIKSAIQRSRQNEARRIRRQPFKTQLKTATRKFMDLIAEGKKDEATKLLPRVFKAIDTAAKKHIVHRNTADRQKSKFSRLVSTKK